MRHRVAGKRLNRDTEHRWALRRNLVASLFEHETISTTIQKAKEVKSFAEKLITLAKKGTLDARRRAIAMLRDRDIVKQDEGKTLKTSTVIRKLFSEIGPRYLDRTGGYTRIIRLPLKRLGDNGQLCLLQLVGSEQKQQEKSGKKAAKKARKKAKTDEVLTEEAASLEQIEQTAESEDREKLAEADEPADKKSNQDIKDESNPPEDKKKKGKNSSK